MDFPGFRPVLFFEFGAGKIGEMDAERLELGIFFPQGFHREFRVRRSRKIERMADLPGLLVLPRAEIVSERIKKFRRSVLEFGTVRHDAAVKNLVHGHAFFLLVERNSLHAQKVSVKKKKRFFSEMTCFLERADYISSHAFNGRPDTAWCSNG